MVRFDVKGVPSAIPSSLNERRLAERGLREAKETLDLLPRTLRNQTLVDDTAQAVLEIIASYAHTWRLLLEYDEDRLPVPPGTGPSAGVLDHERAIGAIAEVVPQATSYRTAKRHFHHNGAGVRT